MNPGVIYRFNFNDLNVSTYQKKNLKYEILYDKEYLPKEGFVSSCMSRAYRERRVTTYKKKLDILCDFINEFDVVDDIVLREVYHE